MKIIYDPQGNVLSILLSEKPIISSSTVQEDMVFDYDQDGNVVKLEIANARRRVDSPQTVEYSVNLTSTEPQSSPTLEERREFLKLPIEERRRLLAQQASDIVDHYQHNTDWKEFLAGDIIDY